LNQWKAGKEDEKTMKQRLVFLALVLILLAAILTALPASKRNRLAAAENDSLSFQLDVEANKQGVAISPNLFGAFFEDINYAADGGLYAELVQNRSFEFASHAKHWSLVRKGGDEVDGTFKIAGENPLNPNNPNYAQVTAPKIKTGQEFGISNSGFGGIPILAGESYNFSFYARSGNYNGLLKISLEDMDQHVFATAQIAMITNRWQKYSGKLQSNTTENRARLVVTLTGPGTVDMDMISLFPAKTWKNRANGLRPDLMQLLADLKPKFLRFPGGCVVEGNKLTDAYDWKNTIGDVAERRENTNLWGLGRPYSYDQSYGLGFYEFFQLCEDIGAEPVPVLNAGMACQVRNNFYTYSSDTNVAYPLEQLAKSKYVQDMIDLLEFANGPATSVWGAKRAAMGHPEPFNLKYLGIGNENWGPEYKERYDICRSELLARSPYAQKIKLIMSSGTVPDGMVFDDVWNTARSQENYVGLVDEHFYMKPEWFYDNVNRYDEYERGGTKVFAGEYAAHVTGKRNNMEGALAEAAFMTGLVRNSDVVEMACYAPLFNHASYSQWVPDLIFFNQTASYGTPNYYVQKMFSTNMGTYTLNSNMRKIKTKEAQKAGKLYSVVSKDEKTGDFIITVVNPTGDDLGVKINLTKAGNVGPTGKATVLTSGDLSGENSFSEPEKVVPVTSNINAGTTFNYQFKKYSLTVLRIPAR
jgi:Alpha-L-arabinofuranosidase